MSSLTCGTYFCLSLLSYSLLDQVEFDENYFDRLSIQALGRYHHKVLMLGQKPPARPQKWFQITI